MIDLTQGELRRLQIAVSRKVYELEESPSLQSQMFRELYRSIKKQFGVESYKEVQKQDLQNAIQFIEGWFPEDINQKKRA